MVEISIKDNGDNRYTYEASSEILGRMYDNNSESIVVNFPEAEIGHTCTMIIVKGIEVVDHIEVEDGKEILITSNLSRFKSVDIGFSFSGAGDYVKNSESKKFKFLNAECPDDFVPEPPQQTGSVEKLIKQSFAGVRLKDGTDNVYEFVNILGELVTEVEINGGIVNEADPTVPSYVKAITQQNIINWNNKVDLTTNNLVNYYLKKDTYSKAEVHELIGRINSLGKEIVSTLPIDNIDENTLYLVPKQDGSGDDYYDEYLYINGRFEFIGTTKTDLEGYEKTEDVDRKLAELKAEIPIFIATQIGDNEYSISVTSSEEVQQEFDEISNGLDNINGEVV